MATIFFLVKFFENLRYANEFVNGKIHCNTVKWFKRLEGGEISGRADCNEGTIGWFQPELGSLVINSMDITNDLAGPIQFQRKWLDYLHLYCLHAVHSGQLDPTTISNKNIEVLRRQLLIPKACSAFGRYAVVVKNVPEFVRRMEDAARKKRYKIVHALVKYYDPNTFHGQFRDVESLFRKQCQFNYQREFRFAIDSGVARNAPLVINIGDISSISTRLNASELNSDAFLGGDLRLSR